MTKLEEIEESLALLRQEVRETREALLDALAALGSAATPAEPEPMVPLIVDALSIVRAEQAATAREKMKGLRKRNMVGLPEDYEGHAPYATGL